MLLKVTAFLKGLLSVSIYQDNRKEFTDSINKTNVARAKTTSLMFVFLEILLLLSSFIFKKDGALKAPGLYYTVMYLVLLFAMVGFYFAFCRLEKDISRFSTEIFLAGIFFTGFILCWCAGVSVLDQMSSGQIMVYVFAVIAVAVTPFFKPFELILLYLPIHIVFLIMLTAVSQTHGAPFGNIVNSTTFIIVAWLISSMRYKTRVSEFNNTKLIEEKNVELNRINSELHEANRMLEELSRTDGLTGVFNRPMFDLTIQLEWDRCKRQFKPLSLLMIDIDFFKAFNDHYGHQAGDECLRQVARALTSCAKRASDTVARYGGEEFVVILPFTGKKHAEMLAEQIREKVEELAIPHAFSMVSKNVTISLGVYTATPSNEIPVEDFIKKADVALYDAKKYRNNVVVSTLK